MKSTVTSMLAAALLICACSGTLAQESVQNSSSIKFSYAGTTFRNSSSVFPDGKTDYNWGEVESHEDHFHIVSWSLYPSEPNSLVYSVRFSEVADIVGGRLSIERTWEIDGESEIVSIEAARDLAQKVSLDGRPDLFFNADTDSDSQRRMLLAQFFFLGVTKRQNLLELPVGQDFQGSFVEEPSAYEFRKDPDSGFIVEIRSVRRPDPPPPPPPPTANSKANNPFDSPSRRRARTLGGTSLSNFELTGPATAEWTFESVTKMSGGKIVRFELNRQVTDLTNAVDWPFELKDPPENGDVVTLMDQQQIAAEWKDGKIVRAYHEGTAEELASAQFRQPPQNRAVFWTASGVLVLLFLAGIYHFSRKRSG